MSNPYDSPQTTSRDSGETLPRTPNPWRWFRIVGVIALGFSAATFDPYTPRVNLLFDEPLRLLYVAVCLIGMTSVIIWPRWYTVTFALLGVLGWFVLGSGQPYGP